MTVDSTPKANRGWPDESSPAAGALAGLAGGSSLSANRKDDHIRLAMQQQHEPEKHSDFDDIEFIHHALSGINISDVHLDVRVGNTTWDTPLYINAMTGGTDQALTVNRTLAQAAARTQTTMSSGSLGIALDHPETRESFTVLRDENPNGFLIANIGAGRPLSDAQRAVELLDADALQVHINPVQETIMPEGSRNFGSWLDDLAEIVERLEVPVIVKEVGFGLSKKTLQILREIGVETADVAGTGGTNFARIEASRRTDGYDDLLDYGQSTACCLLDAPEFTTLLASGGVRSPIDAVKALALGASAVGIAGRILRVAVDGSSETVVEHLEWWLTRIAELSALLGASHPVALRQTDVLLRGGVREFCMLRGIDAAAYSRRSV
jgi:isopentenyl-diphosphate delta-isomerase